MLATVVDHRCLHTASCDQLFQSRHFKLTVSLTKHCTALIATIYGRPMEYSRPLYFVGSSIFLSFFPRLILAVADWMSTILLHNGVALV